MRQAPPELEDATTARTADNPWQTSLRRWARDGLRQGRTGLLDRALPLFERTLIETALEHTGGRRQEAAHLLGWGRNTLTRKIKELRLDPDTPAVENAEYRVDRKPGYNRLIAGGYQVPDNYVSGSGQISSEHRADSRTKSPFRSPLPTPLLAGEGGVIASA